MAATDESQPAYVDARQGYARVSGRGGEHRESYGSNQTPVLSYIYQQSPRFSGKSNLVWEDRLSGASNLNYESSNGSDDDRSSNISGVTTVSYARKRTLLRKLSKLSRTGSKVGSKSAGPGTSLSAVKRNWTQKLNDYRELDVGILKSLLPLKAAIAASLASSVCFAPFVPANLSYYGAVSVIAVGMILETNVGLTLMRGYNLMVGAIIAAACAFLVGFIVPYTGEFRIEFLLIFVFLGGSIPRMIKFPILIKNRWSHAITFYIALFHGLILAYPLRTGSQFFANAISMSIGFVVTCLLSLLLKPAFAGDALVALVVSDIHTAAVVLERIVEGYCNGTVLTKIQDLLHRAANEDEIYSDIQFIIKSSPEVDKLMTAVPWEPSHGKFFNNYPWELYPELVEKLRQVVQLIIALDSSLRAEIQAPLNVRQIFAEDMEATAKEFSLLFHRIGDGLHEHKKVDYQANIQSANLTTLNLRTKLSKLSGFLITQDAVATVSRCPSFNSVQEEPEESEGAYIVGSMSDMVGSLKEDPSFDWVTATREEQEQDITTKQDKVYENEWQTSFLQRKGSIDRHWATTQQQMSNLSLIGFVSLLIEIMANMKPVVSLMDEFALKARFSSDDV